MVGEGGAARQSRLMSSLACEGHTHCAGQRPGVRRRTRLGRAVASSNDDAAQPCVYGSQQQRMLDVRQPHHSQQREGVRAGAGAGAAVGVGARQQRGAPAAAQAQPAGAAAAQRAAEQGVEVEAGQRSRGFGVRRRRNRRVAACAAPLGWIDAGFLHAGLLHVHRRSGRHGDGGGALGPSAGCRACPLPQTLRGAACRSRILRRGSSAGAVPGGGADRPSAPAQALWGRGRPPGAGGRLRTLP